jgi:hypothetical protein
VSPSVAVAGIIAAIVVISIVALGIAAFPISSPNSQTTRTTNVSSTTSAMSSPVEPALFHEDCALLNSTGTTTCTSSVSKEGETLNFNMTTWNPADFQNTYAFHKQFFGVQVNRSTSLQYSIESANYEGGVLGYFNVDLLVYYINQTGAISQPLASYITESAKVLVNQSDVEQFTGAIPAPASGLYVFVFPFLEQSPAGDIELVIQDSAVVQQGIWFKFGNPLIRDTPLNGTGSGSVQAGLEEWPVMVYSNATTDVVLNASTLAEGVWIAFEPSLLSNVGPTGVNTTMYIAGAVSSSQDMSPAMFVNAFGSNGQRGEMDIPIAAETPVTVLGHPGKFDDLHLANYQNQTDSLAVGLVYSPPANQNRLPLHIVTNVTGLLQNGAVVNLPSWLQVSSQASSFYLDPDQPFYYLVSVTTTSQAPLGTLTIVLSEKINGQAFTSYLIVTVQKPLFI